jgi:hypothetical protein
MKNHRTRETRQATNVGSTRAAWILTWSNISTTASECIMDTLELFPHNYQMPKLSSTDRLLMAAKDMTDALQNPHPEVPFASVGDDTIAALTDLVAIFKLKLQQPPSPATHAAPAKVIQRPSLAPTSNQILSSPRPISQQTRSQTTIHTQDIPNVPLPPRVVTPRTIRQPPPTMPLRTTSAEWTPPTWHSPSDMPIGHNSTKPTQSSTQSPKKKWNARHS